MLRERLEDNVDFLRAAKKSIGGACEEMMRRFLNLTSTDRNIERGYTAEVNVLRSPYASPNRRYWSYDARR